jgi:hypothetical protein
MKDEWWLYNNNNLFSYYKISLLLIKVLIEVVTVVEAQLLNLGSFKTWAKIGWVNLN